MSEVILRDTSPFAVIIPSVRGPAGPQGPIGPQGFQGPPGEYPGEIGIDWGGPVFAAGTGSSQNVPIPELIREDQIIVTVDGIRYHTNAYFITATPGGPTPAQVTLTTPVPVGGDQIDIEIVKIIGERGLDGPQGPQGPSGGPVPTGGTAGQIISKLSAADFDVGWLTPGYFATGSDAANLTGTLDPARIADASLPIAKTGGLQGALDAKADLVSGKVPSSQIPALALTAPSVVSSEAEQLALTAQEGDVAIRSDLNKSFMHNGGTAGTMADWTELLTPTDLVLSVNGETGAVSLVAAEIPFTPTGTIAATDVQAAIEEVAAEAGGGGGGLSDAFNEGVVAGTTGTAPGTGSFTPNAAVAGARAWSIVPTGFVLVRYVDGSAWELRYGYWNGTAITRPTNGFVESSSGSGLSLSVSATATLVEAIRWDNAIETGRGIAMSTNATNWSGVGHGDPFITGTAVGDSVATTNAVTEKANRAKITSGTAAGDAAAIWSHYHSVVRSSGMRGGQRTVLHWGITAWGLTPDFFAGVTDNNFTPVASPLSSTDRKCAGFTRSGSTGGTLSWMVNDGTSPATTVDTGIILALDDWYKAVIWNHPGSLRQHGLLMRESTGEIWYSSTVTDVPPDGTRLLSHVMLKNGGGNGGTSVVVHVGALSF